MVSILQKYFRIMVGFMRGHIAASHSHIVTLYGLAQSRLEKINNKQYNIDTGCISPKWRTIKDVPIILKTIVLF
jgi:hypothetical protein